MLANFILSLWLWFGAGEVETWIQQDAAWRYTHLGFLLFSAILLYFATLWLTGVRLHHLLMPQKNLVSSS
jgi:hypothetical protein